MCIHKYVFTHINKYTHKRNFTYLTFTNTLRKNTWLTNPQSKHGGYKLMSVNFIS